MGSSLTRRDLLALPASVPVWPTAGRALGLGRSTTYELITRGEFPVRVLRLGRQYRVATADLLALLGIEQDSQEGGDAA